METAAHLGDSTRATQGQAEAHSGLPQERPRLLRYVEGTRLANRRFWRCCAHGIGPYGTNRGNEGSRMVPVDRLRPSSVSVAGRQSLVTADCRYLLQF